MIVLAYAILGIVGLAIAGILVMALWLERGFLTFFLAAVVIPTCLIVWALNAVGWVHA